MTFCPYCAYNIIKDHKRQDEWANVVFEIFALELDGKALKIVDMKAELPKCSYATMRKDFHVYKEAQEQMLQAGFAKVVE